MMELVKHVSHNSIQSHIYDQLWQKQAEVANDKTAEIG